MSGNSPLDTKIQNATHEMLQKILFQQDHAKVNCSLKVNYADLISSVVPLVPPLNIFSPAAAASVPN